MDFRDKINIKNVEPITPNDQEIYGAFFNKELDLENYGNNWAYITQACRGAGGLGYKYFDGKNLLSIGYHNNHFVIVRPLGNQVVSSLEKLAFELHQKLKKPVYVKHVLKRQKERLKEKGFIDIEKYPWNEKEPKDDDTFPQVIIDLDRFFSELQTSKNAKLKLSLNRYINKLPLEKGDFFSFQAYDPIRHDYQIRQAQEVIKDWASNNSEFMEPYNNMVYCPPKEGINYLVERKGSLLGFLVFGKIGKETVACYANIFSYREEAALSEAGLVTAFLKLKDEGIEKVNLGGSEKESLHKFKLKFNPHELKETYHLVFYP